MLSDDLASSIKLKLVNSVLVKVWVYSASKSLSALWIVCEQIEILFC